MEIIELSKPYIGVQRSDGLSYGGSQLWAENQTMRLWGCGVTAACDLLLYRMGRRVLSEGEYLAFREEVSGCFPLIPHCGIDGVRLALGLSRCFRRWKLPLRCRWSTSGKDFWPRLCEMLRADIPVILAVGPNFPPLLRREKLPLYRKTAHGSYAEDQRITGHYVTVTGADGAWLRVSSWGRQYYINSAQYAAYARRHSYWLFSNLLYVTETKTRPRDARHEQAGADGERE